ncbi:DUF5677 domain-containing protein [Herbiconiux sp. VKM Ac-2851]|uniref:DUF5677 domain-containing protein n=1 Tax=Herbiconiux sp. VKM Ac-2851 TaxID=2739025 RepID=UPI00156447D7|nr:DUF5677 domain-containing protein [Herbiconiux sp. VKM Ac-2851]NQX34730.1 hypothetical protein [Herbiconiux sp. VKM Ac-2851]
MTVDKIDYRAVLAELTSIWRSHSSERSIEVRSDLGRPTTPVLIRGLAAHAVECGQAILVLYKNSLPLPAVPIVRTLMEDAMTAGWLLVDEDAWRSFVSEAAQKKRTALREVLEMDPDNTPAAERMAESQQLLDDLGMPSNNKIQQRFRALEGGERLYLMYRAASALSHAESTVVDLYTEVDPRSPVGVVWRDHAAHTNASAWIAVAATHLLFALIAWDSCRLERPDQDRLESIATKLGVRADFVKRTSL